MMTAPAIIRPREIDTNIGPTSHSRRSNFWVLAMRTALFVAEVQTLSHRQLPSMDGDEHSRLAFGRDVEGNRKESAAGARFASTLVGKQICQCS
jgi:hypothetical protein